MVASHTPSSFFTKAGAFPPMPRMSLAERPTALASGAWIRRVTLPSGCTSGDFTAGAIFGFAWPNSPAGPSAERTSKMESIGGRNRCRVIPSPLWIENKPLCRFRRPMARQFFRERTSSSVVRLGLGTGEKEGEPSRNAGPRSGGLAMVGQICFPDL